MSTKIDAPADDITLPALHKGIDSGLAVGLRAYARRAILADRASPSRAAWIDVAARLPEPGKAVLLDIGKKTPIRAMWVKAKSLEASDEEGFGEYDEAADMYYCPEGWYEWNEHEETHWAVSATPLRWMSIPVPSAVDVGAAQAETAQAAPAWCSYCGGAGDVHSLDGEWRGECTECPVAITRTFKNFHANLCKRSGYAHDEKGWQRDLVSLEEHIAKLVAQAAPTDDTTSREQYRRMFIAACEALGLVNEALGLDSDDGGAEPILAAIRDLKAAQAAPVVPAGYALIRSENGFSLRSPGGEQWLFQPSIGTGTSSHFVYEFLAAIAATPGATHGNN